ncbi:MAG TPA: hypothetical protein VMG31_15840 [Verrucomicrobiae bacterium]|nr:hypothetical protein [Verrucomicrobiae bacterium]
MAALLLSSLAYGQDYYSMQEVRVSGLPSLMAKTKDPADVLLTSLDTVVHDREICCGRDSALEDSARRADPTSLKDVASKLQGRHLLNDGRPIQVVADYTEAPAINSGGLIAAIRGQHALLFDWNTHLYVLYGVTYLQTVDNTDGTITYSIQNLLLIDPRYSGPKREVVFHRETDDWGQVRGMLQLSITRP